jgi:ubiquinone/menaquinone biosynthesis C-methylase UbiE
MENTHKETWLKYEADAWFDRNKHAVIQNVMGGGRNDSIVNLLQKYNISLDKVLEIGCSAGYRLNDIKNCYPNCEVYGIDPSQKAIEFGKQHFPDAHLQTGTIDKLPYEKETFDVVIVGFVFYVVDRDLLLQSIAEIDRVLKNNGLLIIIDFFSARPLKNEYAHIKEYQSYVFKQKYEDVFMASELYHLMDKTTLNHATNAEDAQTIFHDLVSVVMLRKDYDAAYR